MAERVASALVWAMYAYVACGAIFAACFVTRGVQRIDSQARHAGFTFRLLIFPGVAALWPLLAHRWIDAQAEPPIGENPRQ